MEPKQYTGKSGATQGGPTPTDGSPAAAAPVVGPTGGAPTADPAPSGPIVTPMAGPTVGPRPRLPDLSDPAKASGAARLMVWGLVAAALVAGLTLYFRYERAVVPLFGGGR